MSIEKIPINKIDLIQPSRKLKRDVVEQIAKSVKENGGLFQPIGVVAHGDRFRLVWGHHRLDACLLAGLTEIEARKLPADTTPDQEIEFSMQENSFRASEDFESTLARVEALAAAKNCSFKAAAELVGVSGSYVSKAQSAVRKLAPAVKALAKEKGVGISILYPISKAAGEQEQLSLVKQYLDGSINRDGIEKAIKRNRTHSRTGKTVRVKLSIDGIGVQLVLPASADYESISMFLGTLRNRFNTHSKQNIPVHLLPEVMKGN